MAGTAITLMWVGLGSTLANLPLLHDVYKKVEDEGYGDLWAGIRAKYSHSTQAGLEAKLNDPEYQREAREQIWREVGRDLTSR